MIPELIWLSLAGGIAAGLAYYAYFVVPEGSRRRLRGSVRAFGRAVELRFPSHAGLTDEVSSLACRVGKRLGLGPGRLEQLDLALRLRDVGLCAIPYRLNARSWPEWSLSEASTYDCHPDVGGAILEAVPALAGHAEVVRTHHAPFARAEGSPKLEARIVKACAEFVWFSRHLGEASARQHLEEGSGTLYDPAVASLVLKLAR